MVMHSHREIETFKMAKDLLAKNNFLHCPVHWELVKRALLKALLKRLESPTILSPYLCFGNGI